MANNGDAMKTTDLPQLGIVMKVGPHSGMSLEQIVASKTEEESRLGVHYWGYSGTLCQPPRVIDFMAYAVALGQLVDLLLLETKSDYGSSIGHVSEFSRDGKTYEPFAGPVQLQGAQFAFVARDLTLVDQDLFLDDLVVVGGANDGRPLSQHLRSRVNKAFVRRANHAVDGTRARLALKARLVEPYVVWLRP